MLLTSCYVPCVSSSEDERTHGNHEQGSLKLHTSLHVEKSGTHQLRGEEGEKATTINNHIHMHLNVQYV